MSAIASEWLANFLRNSSDLDDLPSIGRSKCPEFGGRIHFPALPSANIDSRALASEGALVIVKSTWFLAQRRRDSPTWFSASIMGGSRFE